MSVRWFSWTWRTWCCRIWGGSRSSWCTLTVVRWRHEVVCRNSVGRFCKAASAPGKGVGSADDRPDGDVGGAETKQKTFGFSDQTLAFCHFGGLQRKKYLQWMGHTTYRISIMGFRINDLSVISLPWPFWLCSLSLLLFVTVHIVYLS